MFGLPKSTEINRPLPKKAVYDKFKPDAADRKLFDEQINRLAIVAEISPQTVSISATPDISAVYVILVTMKTAQCDKKNITLLAKLIDQRMLFALQFEDSVRFAVYHTERVFISDKKPLDDFTLQLTGIDLSAVWDNLARQIGDINAEEGKSLSEAIIENERIEKLKKKITAFEKRAMNERQPRRKLEMVGEIRKLKRELEGLE